MYAQEVANRLKLLRQLSGRTQAEISVLSGVAQNNISRYESGERLINTESLLALSRCYHVSVDYILTGSEIKEHNMLEMFENVSNITGLSIKAVMVLYLLKRGTLKGVEETKSTEKLEFISEMIENFGKEW